MMIDLIAVWFTRLAPNTQTVRICLYENTDGRRWTRHDDDARDPGAAFHAYDAALATVPRTIWKNAYNDDYLITFRPSDHPTDLLVGDDWERCGSVIELAGWAVEISQPAGIERAG